MRDILECIYISICCLVFDIEVLKQYYFTNLTAVLIAHWSSLYLYKESKCTFSLFVCVAMCQGVEFINIVSIIWNNPTSLHSYVHLTCHYISGYTIFFDNADNFFLIIVLQFWLSTILINANEWCHLKLTRAY
jgi:hypothetical protein